MWVSRGLSCTNWDVATLCKAAYVQRWREFIRPVLCGNLCLCELILMHPEDWKNKISQQECPRSHSYSMYSDIINKRSMMSSGFNNGWFPSAEVRIRGNLETVEKDHCAVRRQGCFFFPLPFSEPYWINCKEDGDVNVSGENNTLTPLPHWLAPGHTGVTKSYRFVADGRAGLASE